MLSKSVRVRRKTRELVVATLKKPPYLFDFCYYFYRRYKAFIFSRMTAKQIFRRIYVQNNWGGSESVSGPGSSLSATDKLRHELPKVFRTLRITSILDIPCGDYNWMKAVDREGIQYIGADIVPEIVLQNKLYEDVSTSFRELDMLTDSLPTVSLILCRDCLVHFSYEDIFAALLNVCRSESLYLLTTTYCDITTNSDIVTGEWRPLNLQAPPFYLPEPEMLIRERSLAGRRSDKCLGLWKLSDIDPKQFRRTASHKSMQNA